MGTVIDVLLPQDVTLHAIVAVRALFVEWEQTFSRFQPESALSRLNRRTGETISISPLFCQVLATALDAAQATGGLFDPTLHAQLIALGYDRSFQLLPPADESGTYIPQSGGGWHAIHLDRIHSRVTLPAGVQLDFGGIAKGMAVDAALSHLQDLGVPAALVNAGGDLAVHGSPPDGDWPVAVATRGVARLIVLRRGALATSGVARRRWLQGPHTRHHLLDPRTGLPANSGLWSVSVAAARCVQAEVAAKAAFMLGPTAGAGFLRDRRLSGLLVMENGEEHTVGSWPSARNER